MANTARFRIHFTDNYGTGTIECETREEYNEAMKNVQADAYAEDIWTEYWDEEEGWQA